MDIPCVEAHCSHILSHSGSDQKSQYGHTNSPGHSQLGAAHPAVVAAEGQRGIHTRDSMGKYLPWCHSATYTHTLPTMEGGESSVDLREFDEWVRKNAPKLALDKVHYHSFS